MQMKEALQLQLEVERRLHQQLEVSFPYYYFNKLANYFLDRADDISTIVYSASAKFTVND